jgi:hypothetical protein
MIRFNPINIVNLLNPTNFYPDKFFPEKNEADLAGAKDPIN